jgi:NAD-dependent SIR2 family protein deacetylase
VTMVPSQLKKLYQENRLIPFIGAGVSIAVQWIRDGKDQRGVSWKELVDEASRQLGFQDPELARARGTDLQILEYFRIKNQQFAKLNNWFVRTMHAPDEALRSSRIHAELARMEKCRLFYTTNFDEFLERGLELNGRKCNVLVTEADMGLFAEDCQVVKFHGDLNNPDVMVLSESDYEKRLAFREAMDFRLRSDVLGRAVLFIGYSFRDPNVAYLFHLVNEQFKELPASLSGRRAYIVVPDPSDFEISLFNERNIEVLSVDSDDVTQGVLDVLRTIRS